MVSKNAILLPEDTTDLKNWEPESTNFEEALGKDAKIAGFAYHYDVAKKDVYKRQILGRFMAMVMVHRQDFNPRRAIAIPPTIPPIVRAMTPIVP